MIADNRDCCCCRSTIKLDTSHPIHTIDCSSLRASPKSSVPLLDNTRRARVVPKGLKLRDTGYALAMFLSHPAMTHPCSNRAIFIHPSRITTSIHDNSNYAAILSPGSPSTKWSSFRTLFWTRGFSIARETYKRLVKNRSADRFRDIAWTDGWTDVRTD